MILGIGLVVLACGASAGFMWWILSGERSGRPVPPVPPEPATPVTAPDVRRRLSFFDVSESQLEHLCTVIDDSRKLAEVATSLEAIVHERMRHQVSGILGQWPGPATGRPEFKEYFLAIAQGSCGPSNLHPAFDSMRGLIHRCPGQFESSLASSIDQGYKLRVSPNNMLDLFGPHSGALVARFDAGG